MMMYILAYLFGALIGFLVFTDKDELCGNNKDGFLATVILAIFWPISIPARILRVLLR